MRGRLGGLGGDGALILAAVFLGLNFVAIKVAVVSVPPLLIGAFRFVLGGLLLLGVLRLVENAGRPKPGALLVMLGIGLVGGTLFNAALNEGMSLTSASNSALIMATAPIWGMFLAAALGVETLNIRSLLGAGISLLGVVLILGKGLDGSASSLLGDVLVLVAATSFGAYSVLSRREQVNHSPLTIAAYTTLLGGLALFPLATTELASWNVGAVSFGAWAAVGYLTVFSTAFAYGVWQHGIAHRAQQSTRLPVPDHLDGRPLERRPAPRRFRPEKGDRRYSAPGRRLPLAARVRYEHSPYADNPPIRSRFVRADSYRTLAA